jgi:putative DNA primase/helicase
LVPYYDSDRKLIGRFPAVIAPIIGAEGSLQSALWIYAADLDPRKKTMSPVDTIAGAAVRRHGADRILGIAEGIETELAAHVLFRVPVWAVLSAYGIESFNPLTGLGQLHVFADNDGNFVGPQPPPTGSPSASRAPDPKSRSIDVHIPMVINSDFNDVLRAKQP